jgi:hypothetical protein
MLLEDATIFVVTKTILYEEEFYSILIGCKFLMHIHVNRMTLQIWSHGLSKVKWNENLWVEVKRVWIYWRSTFTKMKIQSNVCSIFLTYPYIHALPIYKNCTHIFNILRAFFSAFTETDKVNKDFLCRTGKTIPINQRCILDYDVYGNTMGCRDLSHLDECGIKSFIFPLLLHVYTFNFISFSFQRLRPNIIRYWLTNSSGPQAWSIHLPKNLVIIFSHSKSIPINICWACGDMLYIYTIYGIVK